MNNFPQIILVSEIVTTYTLSLISMVHGNCSVYDDYSLLCEVRTFHFLKNVSRFFPSFLFLAPASCISTRLGFWFTFYFRAAALQAVFHVHSTKSMNVFWPLYFGSVSFSTLILKWIFWKNIDTGKVQSSMFTFDCQTRLALGPVAFQRGQSLLLFWKGRLLGKVWMKVVKTNGLPLGPDGFNAMRNANLLPLLLDIQEMEAKKQRRVCARKIMMMMMKNDTLTCLLFGVQHEFIHCFVIC